MESYQRNQDSDLAKYFYHVIDEIPGSRWERFARVILKLRENTIDELKHDYPRLSDQKFKALKEWQAKQGSRVDIQRVLSDLVDKFLHGSDSGNAGCENRSLMTAGIVNDQPQNVFINSNVTIVKTTADNNPPSVSAPNRCGGSEGSVIGVGISPSGDGDKDGLGEIDRRVRDDLNVEMVEHAYIEEGAENDGKEALVTRISEEVCRRLKSVSVQSGAASNTYPGPGISEHEKFFELVNEWSKTRCKQDISKNFDDKVRNPESTVNPVMTKTNFFVGGTIPDERNYTITDERASKIEARKGKEITTPLQDIHVHGRYIFLIGSAGSGKTTLIKRYTEMVIQKQVKALIDVQMTHLVNIRDVARKTVTPRDMLFGKFLPGKNKRIIDAGYEWLQDESNQRSLLLAFDGLDTVPWDMRDGKHECISYDDEATADTIMFNILSGHLFKNCWIVVTAREYAIAQFPRRIRPDAVVVIKGLARSSIEILVKELAGTQGNAIWEYLRGKSSYLMLLCANPLFLILAVIMRMAGEELPDNISGTILKIIQSHLYSENGRIKPEAIEETLEKLEKLSLCGLQEGKVVFSKSHFDQFQLEIKDVEDIIISAPAPDRDFYKQRIVEKDYDLFFCRQSFQEALGALGVARKKLAHFNKFIEDDVHKVYYTVVRQMLCGFLFGENVQLSSSKYTDIEKKRRTLLKSFEKQLKREKDSPMALLNLLISLRECGQNDAVTRMIRKCLPKIDISGILLSMSDIHAIATMARQCEKLDIMKLVDSQLSGEGLEVLAEEMRGSEVEITVFDVSFNANLRKQSMANLYEICRRGYGLNYWQCGFKQRDILDFNPSAPKIPVEDIDTLTGEQLIKKEFDENEVLELSHYNVETHSNILLELVQRESDKKNPLMLSITGFDADSSVSVLCNILREVRCAKGLIISHCSLSTCELESIREALQKLTLEILNIFLNQTNDPTSWRVFGSIIEQCGTKLLFLTACSLTDKKLQALLSNADGCLLDKLDVSRNKMDTFAMEALGDFISRTHPNELIMGYCEITGGTQLNALRLRAGKTELQRLDMSGNNKMGEDGFKELGLMVDQCEVAQLDASECDPSAGEMRSFKQAASNAKLMILNISRNRRLGDDGLQQVGEIGRICHIQKLFVRQCGVKESSLRRFQRGLGDAKIGCLDFGRYFMKSRPTTRPEVEILAELMRNVTEQLTLNDWDIQPEDRRWLVKRLQALPRTKLEVVFNRGKKDHVCQA